MKRVQRHSANITVDCSMSRIILLILFTSLTGGHGLLCNFTNSLEKSVMIMENSIKEQEKGLQQQRIILEKQKTIFQEALEQLSNTTNYDNKCKLQECEAIPSAKDGYHGWKTFGSYCYEVLNKVSGVRQDKSQGYPPASTEDCKRECAAVGAELASIDSAAENEFIASNILLYGGTPTTYFAGGDYANWVDGPGPCVVMLYDGNNRGKWMKTDCTTGRNKPWSCCTADCICKKKRVVVSK
eukprot:GFUD01020368.1.p1 GENE.GFUD01020368.1~~GFUD01020368.1.p1  ORF type:complete len:241 (+),score=51.86 GFUD01020368.1:271-993(+)